MTERMDAFTRDQGLGAPRDHAFVGKTMRFLPSTDQKELAGRRNWVCLVLRELSTKECDRHETGPMFEVEFRNDAQRFHVFEDELADTGVASRTPECMQEDHLFLPPGSERTG